MFKLTNDSASVIYNRWKIFIFNDHDMTGTFSNPFDPQYLAWAFCHVAASPQRYEL